MGCIEKVATKLYFKKYTHKIILEDKLRRGVLSYPASYMDDVVGDLLKVQNGQRPKSYYIMDPMTQDYFSAALYTATVIKDSIDKIHSTRSPWSKRLTIYTSDIDVVSKISKSEFCIEVYAPASDAAVKAMTERRIELVKNTPKHKFKIEVISKEINNETRTWIVKQKSLYCRNPERWWGTLSVYAVDEKALMMTQLKLGPAIKLITERVPESTYTAKE